MILVLLTYINHNWQIANVEIAIFSAIPNSNTISWKVLRRIENMFAGGSLTLDISRHAPFRLTHFVQKLVDFLVVQNSLC